MAIGNYDREELDELLADRQFRKLRKVISEMNEVDIAEFIEELEPEKKVLVYRMLPKELAADVFSFLVVDDQEHIINSITDYELGKIVEDLYVDDAVDMLEELPAIVVKRVLQNATPQTRNLINQFLQYPENSAGSIMTAEYVGLKKNMTVEQSFAYIRHHGVDSETIYTCYVTDASRHLLGVTTVKELLLHDQDDRIEAFMETNVIYVNTLSDQEEAAAQLSKYDFLALPVVDLEERLVGIITVDDAMDVIQEENTEDIQKMNAIVPTERTYLKTGVLATWKSRIPWLLLLMVSATFTGSIITSFEDKLASMIILTSFIPMLMDTGGNSGGQASVTVIRALSLNEIDMRDIFKVIWKELRVGLLCGSSLAAINFVKVLLVDRLMLGMTGVTLKVDLVISLTLIVEVTLAKMIGCSLPIIAKRLKLDPAVMSSPFVTTIVDAISLLIYFGFATAVLHI